MTEPPTHSPHRAIRAENSVKTRFRENHMAYYREKLRRKSRKNSLALQEVQFLYKFSFVNRKLSAISGHFSKIPEECFEILKIN